MIHLYSTVRGICVDLFCGKRRSESKRYGAIFTCMTNQTIYIEISFSLYAEPFV